MGSYNGTCGISGLAVYDKDPIRMGLIADNPGKHCYSVKYNFWTPLFSAKYNDAGWATSIKPKEIWDWLAPKIAEHVVVDEHYATNDCNEKIELLVHDRAKFDIVNFGTHEPYEVHMWMCHEWAYKHLLKIAKAKRNSWERDKNQVIDKETDFLLNSGKVLAERLASATSKEEKSEIYADEMSVEKRMDTYYVEGLNGFFNSEFINKILSRVYTYQAVEPLGEHRETFRKMIIESTRMFHSLSRIRKIILPCFVSGESVEDNKYLCDWTKLTAKAAAKQKARLDAED